MKFPINWHKSCLKNLKENLAQEEERAASMARSVARSRFEIERYSAQIDEAERRGLDGFDAEKLLGSRKKK